MKYSSSSPNSVHSILQNAGFGFCPKAEQCKVVRLMHFMTFTSGTTVAEVHTLSSTLIMQARFLGSSPGENIQGLGTLALAKTDAIAYAPKFYISQGRGADG